MSIAVSPSNLNFSQNTIFKDQNFDLDKDLDFDFDLDKDLDLDYSPSFGAVA